MKKIIATLLLITSVMAWADAFKDGDAAIDKKDYKTALEKFTPLANQGNARAQFNLGVMYEDGLGVVQDYKQAVRWYTLSAEQGDASAQTNLGVRYLNGQGVLQDYVKAHMWFNIAAANGDAKAPKNRDIVSAKMTSQQIERAQQMARDCMARNYKRCN
jgi:hypothetical protein